MPQFPYRRQAAESIARITGKPASYTGLNDEPIDSTANAEPYKNQDELLARYAWRVFDALGVKVARPQSDAEWQPRNAFQEIVLHRMCGDSGFGKSWLKPLWSEAHKRGLDALLAEMRIPASGGLDGE